PMTKEWLLHEWRLLQRWVHLPEVLQSGKPVHELDVLKQEKNHHNFIQAMAYREKQTASELVKLVPLKDHTRLLDLGGGPGLFAAAFAEKYPNLQATVFDVPESEPIASEYFRQSTAASRLQFKGGDFFEDSIGDGYSYIFISSIIHIFNPDRNLSLLKKCYQALQEGGKIIIREVLLNASKTQPQRGTLFAVNMLVNTEGGNAYPAEEIMTWLQEAGFRNIQQQTLETGNVIVEGVKQ
ncbi:MAG: methyltransferase, partial [Calditrichia bacterium]